MKNLCSHQPDSSFFILHSSFIVNTIAEILKSKGLTLATAESCTGGNIARIITAEPGSSAYFKGSVVAYGNDVKRNLLGVSAEALEKYGAVSQAVVEQMAQGAMRVLKTDLAVATSGIAGPSGGTPEKPVGTVWIAACNREKIISRKFLFGKSRAENITRASETALEMLKEL